MQGDFSRDSFDLQRVFSRVLNQQGRVLLDSDWNEMQSIQLHLMRQLAADLIGPHGGTGFEIKTGSVSGDFTIGEGSYYVDGWLCENGRLVSYAGAGGNGKPPAQPYWRAAVAGKLDERPYLVYLDVWERHLSWPEADGPNEIALRFPPALREVALGGADTASRAQVVWQVKAVRELTLADGTAVELPSNVGDKAGWLKWLYETENWKLWTGQWQPENRGMLTAQTMDPTGAESTTPCAVPPQARYRGVENQLYRVEIHQWGLAGKGASFKWSRENGSVVFPVHSIKGNAVALSAWWRDGRRGLAQGDWVEVLDDIASLHQMANPLRRVKEVDQETMTVYLDKTPVVTADDASRHPILRRWDHRGDKATGSGMNMTESGIMIDEGRPYALEDGIQISFSTSSQSPHQYRNGDYWLIPARTAIADVIWPRKANGAAEARPPMGVEHHYAPLAVVDIGNPTGVPIALRRAIQPVASDTP